MRDDRSAEALIIGAGPAGSAAATLLASAGIETVIIESELAPRSDVGESLLPHTLPLLDRLGAHDAVRALPHTRSHEGVTLATHDGGRQARYLWADALPPALPHGYQVRRDEFHAALLANARRTGTELLAGWRAVAPIWQGRRIVGATARDPQGRETAIHSRVLLDASGTASFLASRMGWRFPYPRHRKVAVSAPMRGAWLPDGAERGDTTIVLADAGWFWLLPFADDSVSAAAVLDLDRWRAQASDPEALFAAAAATAPEITRRLAGATRGGPFTVGQNFSYRVLQVGGDGFCCLGDAAGYFDPIFCSGVFLALASATSAAQDIVEAFGRHGRVDVADLGPTISLTRSLHRLFFALIRAFHDPDVLAFFFAPRQTWRIPAAMTSLLAGDVLEPGRWRRTLRFRSLLALGHAQHWGARMRRPLAPPLAVHPAAGRGEIR